MRASTRVGFGLLGWLLVSQAAFANVDEAAKPQAAGGQASVQSFVGAFNYSFPLEVPPYHGLEPKMAIQYDSSAPNGWLGVGWKLTGWPVIDRASRGKGAPAFDDTDIFLLDGQELLPCAGLTSPGCAAGGTHTTKFENYLKIVHEKVANTWTIWRQDGTRMVLKPTFIAKTKSLNCPLLGVSGGVGVGGHYNLAGLQGAGSRINFYSMLGGNDGPLSPLSLSGFSASGNVQPNRFINVLVGKGSKLELWEIFEGTSPYFRGALTLTGANAQGTISEASFSIKTLYGNGQKLTCRNLTLGSETFRCSGEISFTPSTCGSTEVVAGPARWGISEVVDTRGNNVFYNWACEQAPHQDCYPASVAYNGNLIIFLRKLRDDAISFVSGLQLSTSDKIIHAIDVTIDNKTTPKRVRAYSLNYQTEFHTRRTVLASIGTFGTDAATSATGVTGTQGPPVTFAYTAASYSANTDASYQGLRNQQWCPSTSKMGTGDFNGDGKADMWCQSGTSLLVSLGNWREQFKNGTFAAPLAWAAPKCVQANILHIGTADFDRDGKDDLWCHVRPPSGDPYGVFVYLSNGTNGFSSVRSLQSVEPTSFGVADFDGDGTPDFWDHFNRSKGFTNGYFSIAHATSGGPSNLTLNPWAQNLEFCPLGLISTADFNGDGRADLFCHNAGETKVMLRRGGSFLAAKVWATGFCLTGTMGTGDFNADGKTDLYCHNNSQTDVMLSNGGTSFSLFTTHWVRAGLPWNLCDNASPFGVADFNGDGADDFWCQNKAEGKLYLAEADKQGWFDVRSPRWVASCPSAHVPGVADFTGEGKADLWCHDKAGSTGTGVWPGSTGHTALLRYVGSLGGSTTVEYVSSNYWPNANRPPATATVISKKAYDGRIDLGSTVQYEYEGGLYDRRERRFLGFQNVTELHPVMPTSPATRLAVVTWFNQDYAAPTGEVESVYKREYVKTSSGQWGERAISDTEYQYDKKGGALPYRSQLISEEVVEYNGSEKTEAKGLSAPFRTTLTKHQYNSYGNRTATFFYGETSASGDEKTVTTYYPLNTTKYIVGIPSEVNVYNGIGTAGTKLNQTLTFFDNATAVTTPIAVGNPTKVMKWLTPGNTYVQTLASYDAYGNVVSTTNEVGNVTKYAFDSTYHQFEISLTNALNQETTTGWNTACAAPASIKDLNGQTTTISYDVLCREIRRAMPGGNFINTSYVSFGDANNQHVRTETPGPNGAANLWTKKYFDGLGRNYKTIQSGTAAGKETVTETAYDARGNIRIAKAPRFLSDTVARTDQREFYYDALNRIQQAYGLGLASKTETYHLTFQTVTFDEMGRRTDIFNDAYGRTVRRREYSSASAYSDTLYTYDLRGNLATVTDAAGNVTKVTLDSLGRKLQLVDPDKGTINYTYDAAGRLKSQTDARGMSTTFTYDALGRTRTKTIGALGHTFDYDTAVTGSFNVGRLVKSSHPLGSTSYTYDAAGNVVKETKVVSGTTYNFTYGYDKGGRRIFTTFPDGTTSGTATAPITFDPAGRVASIPGIVTSVAYDASGNPTQIVYANGVKTTRSFNPSSRRLDSIFTTNAAGVALQQLVYSYYLDSTKKSVTSSSPEEGWNYTYDGLGRLASATNVTNAANNQTFTWNNIGNLMSNSRRGTYVYPAAKTPRPHAVIQAGTATYSYDASGNMLTGDGRTYLWDAGGRLSSVSGNGRSLSFAYDDSGERVRTIDNGVTTISLTDEYEVTGGVATKHYSVAGLLVAKKAGATSQWLHLDALGSVNVVTDAAGNEVQRLKYRPFGELLRASTGQTVPLSYTSERRDSSGLLYLHARYYEPSLGRFISADSKTPSAEAVALNRYAYAKNDPINYTDRNGNEFSFGGMWDSFSTWAGGWWNSFNSWGSGFFGGGGSFGGGGFFGGNEPLLNLRGISGGGAAQLGFAQAIGDGMKSAGWSGGSGAPTSFGSAFTSTAFKTYDIMSWASFGGAIKGLAMGAFGGALLGSMKFVDAEKSALINVYSKLGGINKVGGLDNCVACAQAANATMKGYPASALNVGPFKGEEISKRLGYPLAGYTPHEIIDAMKAAGPGAQGFIHGVNKAEERFHTFNVINYRGHVIFFDAQSVEGKMMVPKFDSYEKIFFKPDGFIP